MKTAHSMYMEFLYIIYTSFIVWCKECGTMCRLGIQSIHPIQCPRTPIQSRPFVDPSESIPYAYPITHIVPHNSSSPSSSRPPLLTILLQQLPLRLPTIPPLHIRIPLLMHPYPTLTLFSAFLCWRLPSCLMSIKYAFRRHRWSRGFWCLMTR